MNKAYAKPYLVWVMLLVSGISNAQATHNNHTITKQKESAMPTIQRNKEIIRKLYEELLNKRNMKLLQDLVSEDYTGPQGEKGATGFKETIAPLMKAFPDIQWKVEALIGEGDKVVVRQKIQGTHAAQFGNYAATGKAITNTGLAIYVLKNGKIINAQIHTDRLGFLQQLGVLPLDISSLSNKKAHKDRVSFIDKFYVPAGARNEFFERMRINRDFIKKLPGFIEDAAYVYTDDTGNLICITVALWENREALNKAKEAVQAAYKKEGFDPVEMQKRLNIVTDRGIYTELEEH